MVLNNFIKIILAGLILLSSQTLLAEKSLYKKTYTLKFATLIPTGTKWSNTF